MERVVVLAATSGAVRGVVKGGSRFRRVAVGVIPFAAGVDAHGMARVEDGEAGLGDEVDLALLGLWRSGLCHRLGRSWGG